MDSLSLLQLVNQYVDPIKVFIVILVLIITSKIRSSAIKSSIESKFRKIAQEKRKQRDDQIALERIPPNEIPEETRNLIINSSVTELSKLLNEDKITSEQILKTYYYRAITLGLSLELIAESNYKEALQLARQCDETRRNTRREDRHTLGGLFGIPISIKDSFIQKGLDSTCGSAPNCFSPKEKDGAILAFLKSRGAIPFIRSNLPQTFAVLDCVNYIWGRALNPWNKERVVGGSSGGEAALIAARCSPIGLGSDALGSIRIPAAFTGVIGFKPTTGRYLTKGHSKLGMYFDSKFSATYPNNGPLTRTVDDSVLFMKELINEEGRECDPLSPYVPWNEEKFQSKKKLKIAYSVTEDIFGASKANQRAVRETAENLKRLGHEVVETKIPGFERIVQLLVMITSSEGEGKMIHDILLGEAPIKELKSQIFIKALPLFARKLFKVLLKAKGCDRLATLLGMTEEITVDEYHQRMNEYFQKKEELLNFFLDNKFDAFITPSMPLPALKHGHGIELLMATIYSWPPNMANLPAGVIPVTVVKEGEDVYTPDECSHNDRVFEFCQDTIQGSVGLPVGVQVMALPWEDEKCLAVMKAIESQANFKKFPNI